MTHEEFLSSTDWNPWLQEKAGIIVSAIAYGLADMAASSTAAGSLRDALYNACKIYVHTLQIETRKDLQDTHARMAEFIAQNPDQADVLLKATRSKALEL